MNKRFFSIFIILTMLFSTSYNALAASEKENISENMTKFKQLDSQILSLNSEITNLNEQVAQLQSKLKSNKALISETRIQIKNTEAKIETTKKDIEKEQSILDNRIRALYEGGQSVNYLKLLMSSNTVSSLISTLNAVAKVVTLDKDLITKLDNKKQQLHDDAEKLTEKEAKLKELQISTENDLKDLEGKQSKQKELLKEINNEKEKVASIIKANEEALIAHPLSVINSENSTIDDVSNAISTLRDLLPQINTNSVKGKAQDGINTGTAKLANMKAAADASAKAASVSKSSNNDSGTKATNNTDASSNSNVSFKATYSMESTAYTGGTLTAMGLKPIRSVSGISTVAVDPSVIPLGSKVYIPGYGYAIASDTGSAINGNIIDLYMNSEDECLAWGRRPVIVHIVAYPGQW